MLRITAAIIGAIALPAASFADASSTLTIALGGDLIGPYQVQTGEPAPDIAAVNTIFRNADAAIANFEGSSFDLSTFTGVPAAENGGGYPVIPPANMPYLTKTMGLDLVSKANNHATDWSYDGLLATLATTAANGLTQAGAGRTEEAARRAAYFDTAKGRIALVSVATSFTPMSVAGAPVERGGRTFDRPGISVLRIQPVRVLTPERYSSVVSAAGPLAIPVPDRPDEIRISDQRFRKGDGDSVVWEADPTDLAAVLGAVRAARKQARVVVLAVHAHQTEGRDETMPPAAFAPLELHRANEEPSAEDTRPAPILKDVFRAAIDAGADVVTRTGPHVVNGIEVYRGRPIFYSLGSLVFSFGGQRSYTTPAGQRMNFPDGWFHTIVPVVSMDAANRMTVRVRGATLTSSKGNDDGLPRLASGAQEQAMLRQLAKLSASYGTRLRIGKGGADILFPPEPAAVPPR
ncbi:poly-gamma-glutamate synthesis protein (capsule biosynthesis protein) [Novosphingobium chloroacetimidivorans]|uniref:Poly-gamma-glutamate synthesis protein (Capsule biosynthesis protein) n=1 Tax=Novosphingobium chloroacetimidivorans TaxID=1428314 RepID=A0A7W7K817_9SPHN|nr:CapA family protein [Novosphingobium chloroacetimidivorans]MBB4857950.1 poly-gamma-glutamate synthesis protein (capsule biosynthesis protein) [Novosphingobium chloroacetimidivorans]